MGHPGRAANRPAANYALCQADPEADDRREREPLHLTIAA
jgi:hypothetical protein